MVLQDMSNWYGHVVTIVEVDKRRGTIKCAATGRNAKKDPTIWLAPGALTSVVRSTEDMTEQVVMHSAAWKMLVISSWH